MKLLSACSNNETAGAIRHHASDRTIKKTLADIKSSFSPLRVAFLYAFCYFLEGIRLRIEYGNKVVGRVRYIGKI